jgi:tetratricopeptide (TPR) repeat protein
MLPTPRSVPTVTPREADRLRALARRVPVGNASAQNNCGVMLARRGLAIDAAECFERAIAADSRMTLAMQNLQLLAARTRIDADRVSKLHAQLRADPTDAAASRALGLWHAHLGRPGESAAVLSALLDRAPDDVDALRAMAMVEQALGYPDRASAWLDRAIALRPDDIGLHALAGEVLYRRGKTEAARAALEHAMQIDESAAWPQHLLAFVLGDLGLLDEAQAAAQRALAMDPSLARVDMNLTLDAKPAKSAARSSASGEGRAHLNLGLAYRNTGYHDQALVEFETALQRGEPAVDVWTAIAETRALRGEWELAAAAYGEAATAAPTRAQPLVARAAMLVRHGDVSGARQALEHADACESHADGYYLVLGVIESLEGHPAEALAALKRVRGSSRAELAARVNGAWVMRQLGRHAECLEGFRRVTEVDPQNARAWIGIGVAFSELRRLNEACSAFERAVALAPESVDAAYHHAFTLSQLGRYHESVRAMKRAMNFTGEFAPFRFLIVLEQGLADLPIEVCAVDAVNGDAMALMMLSGASEPQVTAEQRVVLSDARPASPMREAVPVASDSARARTPLGAWVALRRGATPVGPHAPVSRSRSLTPRPRRETPVLAFSPVPAADTASAESVQTNSHAAVADRLGALPVVSVRAAEQALRTALARDPDLAQVRVGLAALLREEGRMHDAEVELERALESVPTFHDAARALAELRVDLGRSSDALQALVRPLRANPRDTDLLIALAEALFALGREEQAAAAVARAASIDATHAGVRTLQGYMALRAGHRPDAVQYWRAVAAGAQQEDRWTTRAQLALAEHDSEDVPETPVALVPVRMVGR